MRTSTFSSWATTAALALAASVAHADSWKFPATTTDRTFDFDATRIVLTTDARKSQRMPDFQMRVLLAGREQARFPGVSVDQIFASPDKKVFLGLSNQGLPGTAVILFSNTGRIILLANHGLAEFDYCSKSVTLARDWYDQLKPEIRWDLDNEKNPGIYLRDCKGQTIELLSTVQLAYARAAQLMAKTPR
ncbi:hypothetical protein ACNI65_14310 [Roseateles sp. So40a]|uniref:hypothetical protein n=1 Tax=Roseateles sp. So40a TaxID=3400226 RepID=UPI003A85D7AC